MGQGHGHEKGRSGSGSGSFTKMDDWARNGIKTRVFDKKFPKG